MHRKMILALAPTPLLAQSPDRQSAGGGTTAAQRPAGGSLAALAVLQQKGMPQEDTIDSFEALGIQVIPFGFSEAAAWARFITSATIAQGLSLGDRACLATAQLRGAKAVTSDRAWRIPDLGVEIEFLR